MREAIETIPEKACELIQTQIQEDINQGLEEVRTFAEKISGMFPELRDKLNTDKLPGVHNEMGKDFETLSKEWQKFYEKITPQSSPQEEELGEYVLNMCGVGLLESFLFQPALLGVQGNLTSIAMLSNPDFRFPTNSPSLSPADLQVRGPELPVLEAFSTLIFGTPDKHKIIQKVLEHELVHHAENYLHMGFSLEENEQLPENRNILLEAFCNHFCVGLDYVNENGVKKIRPLFPNSEKVFVLKEAGPDTVTICEYEDKGESVIQEGMELERNSNKQQLLDSDKWESSSVVKKRKMGS